MQQCLRTLCFFFSSRKRHTRLVSDWSSDVCSSDLEVGREGGRRAGGRLHRDDGPPRDRGYGDHRDLGQIGRASCRERGYISRGAGSIKEKTGVTQGIKNNGYRREKKQPKLPAVLHD